MEHCFKRGFKCWGLKPLPKPICASRVSNRKPEVAAGWVSVRLRWGFGATSGRILLHGICPVNDGAWTAESRLTLWSQDHPRQKKSLWAEWPALSTQAERCNSASSEGTVFVARPWCSLRTSVVCPLVTSVWTGGNGNSLNFSVLLWNALPSWSLQMYKRIRAKDRELSFSLSLEVLYSSYTLTIRSVAICPDNCSYPKG